VSNAKRTRFDVLVGDASTGLTTDRAYAPHQQTTISGSTVEIRWTMESLDVEAINSRATISYERLNTASKVKNYRMALVNIRISFAGSDAFGAGDCIFAGRVTGQTITHDRVVLTCDGLDTIAGRIPALGVERVLPVGTGKSTNTISVFNEAGKPDKRGDAATGLQNDRLEDGDDGTWTTWEAAVMCCQRIHDLMDAGAGGATFRFDMVKDLDIGGTDKSQRMDQSETRPAGALDLLQQAAAENGYVIISAIDTSDTVTYDGKTFYASMYPLAYSRFDDARKKNITWNKYQTIAGCDLDGIPFPMTLTLDDTQASKIVAYSGKRRVCTVLEIDPSNTDYTETTTDENGKPMLRFHAAGYQTSRNYVYESTKTRATLFGANKWSTFSGVNPRITNQTAISDGEADGILVEPVYADQEVIWRFKAGVFPTGPIGSPSETCPFTTSSEILQGGQYWDEAVYFSSKETEALDLMDKIDVKFSQDSLDVTITGFMENEDSEDTGITVEQFLATVSRLLLPVTVDADDREVVLAEHTAQNGGVDTEFYTSDVTSPGDTPGFSYYHRSDQYAHRMFDQIRPIKREDDLGDFSSGTMSYSRIGDSVPVEVDMQEILQKQAKTELTSTTYGDGASLDFTLPIELLGTVLGKDFPVSFGDWLDTIAGHTNVFAGYELPRPLMVVGQSYTQTDIRISLR
jgi:hypothetical protein